MRENTTETTFGEMKTCIKAAVRTRWIKQHPSFSALDLYHSLNRVKQTTIFWLRTEHNRLRKYMYTKLKIGETPICQCGQGPQSGEHISKTSPNLGTRYGPSPPSSQKICMALGET
ncbi:hypothetical protein PoB_003522500 [Plakobranchus ocellatus]|uniref:Uncharacterized protein n=1 Tax=Plakobranchus ocellatus TaxID=259542 RepID=A0AAV4AMZ4_9GAST|nr:hypothetical protein PoB_003522500 [Plakobranchus ocellatus]